MKDKNRKMIRYLNRHAELRTIALSVGFPKKNLKRFLDGKERDLGDHIQARIQSLYYQKRFVFRLIRSVGYNNNNGKVK